MMNEPKSVATAIRHRQHTNGCALYFRSTGNMQTFAGAPCTPNCICAKEVAASAQDQQQMDRSIANGGALMQHAASKVVSFLGRSQMTAKPQIEITDVGEVSNVLAFPKKKVLAFPQFNPEPECA